MAVTIKSQREIELMREAGRILAKTHEELEKALRPGMTTWEINRIGEEVIRSYGCIPSFKNYNGYPASICVSVNDEVVHGIPNKKRIIQEGDIVSLDAGVIYKGYHSDAARTHAIGEISPQARKLIEVTRQSFFEGIKYAKPGNHLNDISSDYAAKIELLTKVSSASDLMLDMFRSYCKLVRSHSMRNYSATVQKVIAIIDSDLSANLSLGVLARSQNINPAYLSTVFKKETGKTVVEYINGERIRLAKHLLETTHLQIQTIAVNCGIMDVQYFSKVFKKHTGKTPKEYRKSLK